MEETQNQADGNTEPDLEPQSDPEAQPDKGSHEENQKDDKGEAKLYRSLDNRVIAGVAGGIAQYFGRKPIHVRIAFVVLAFLDIGLILYLLGVIFLPPEPNKMKKHTTAENVKNFIGEAREETQKAAGAVKGALSGSKDHTDMVRAVIIILFAALAHNFLFPYHLSPGFADIAFVALLILGVIYVIKNET